MFYSELLKKVKPNTVIHYHAVIHSALKYAVKTDMLLQNVADKVDRPKKNDFQPVFLSAEEMQKMFEALRGTRLELPVLVAAFYGFRRGEVHHYVNKETLILTAIGAALGVPLGGLLAESFTYILQMPSLYFDVEVEPLSYVLAVVLSFGFTFIVNLATNRTLNKIDMVGALKSAE